jgi:cysteinyl-tRNA synthetase
MPDLLPKATESIPQIVAFISQLVERDYAYAVEGDVYFSVARDPEYGRLSRQRPGEMQEEERNALKESPQDFALWKATKPGEDTSWDSPWGRGRPGWHIECSVMAEEAFGPVFEIHGGGIDLVFPHHENELAQSRALGHEFARVWMHNGLLEFTGDKMSKSVGNLVTLRDATDNWGRETLLLLFMGAHWRKPMDFSDETLQQARAQADAFRDFFLDASSDGGMRREDELIAALDDDFNTADALALFHDWRSRGDSVSLRWGLELFGLGSLTEPPLAPNELLQLAELRQEARARKDFDEADRLRVEIEAAGWMVRDVAEPPGFRLVPRG